VAPKVLAVTMWLGENPPKFLFLKPNPLVDGIIAQLSLKKYFFPEFRAHLTLKAQVFHCFEV
jgi:hypothetical protein